MASRFAYQLTEKAEGDLDEIVSYIAIQLENKQAATEFINKLQDVILEACSFPESGSPINNELISNKSIRKKAVGNYIMYYFLDKGSETIYVLRILYGRRNLDEIIREIGSGQPQ